MTQNKKKKLSGAVYALGLLGFFLLMWGVGISDRRSEMPEQQAAKELPSPRATAGIVGAGVASVVGAFLLSKKRDDKSK